MPSPALIGLGVKVIGGLLGGKKKQPRVASVIPLDALDPAIDPRIDDTEYHRRLLAGIEMLRRKEMGREEQGGGY